jgi:acetylxylan esterase
MNCWDVTTSPSLTHDGGGDSRGLASAVRYAFSEWGVNPEKVFVTGFSSGAMMTNVMAGTYPDLFKGGAAFAGVAMGCLSKGNAPVFPADPCAAGQVSRTPQQWGDIVKKAYPAYTGSYPKMQLWHGTADNVLNITNLNEVKQWTNMHGISQTATSTSPGTPKSNWAKSVYGAGQVESYVGTGNGHALPEAGTEVVAIDFFGL